MSPAGRISASVSTSPIRSVKSPSPVRKAQAPAVGPDVAPPWKQEGYVASSESEMRETMVTSATQIRTEERWEGRYGVQEQTTISGAAGAAFAAAAKEVPWEPPASFRVSFLQPESRQESPSGVGRAQERKNIQKLKTKSGSCFCKSTFNGNKGSHL